MVLAGINCSRVRRLWGATDSDMRTIEEIVASARRAARHHGLFVTRRYGGTGCNISALSDTFDFMTRLSRILRAPAAVWLLVAANASFAASAPLSEALLAPLTSAY